MLSVALAVATVVIAPDVANTSIGTTDPADRLSLRALSAAFRFPRRAPDFYWALWGRLALVLGYL